MTSSAEIIFYLLRELRRISGFRYINNLIEIIKDIKYHLPGIDDKKLNKADRTKSVKNRKSLVE